jgi:hypothetical protein
MALLERNYLLPLLVLGCAVIFQVALARIPKEIPKVVWSYWDKDPPNSVVKIVNDNKQALKDWEFHFLDAQTVKQFLSENDFPRNYYTLSPQHKADYIRLLLLKKYGGLWLDASIILYQPEAINQMRLDGMKKRAELIAFTLHEPQEEYIENWFIMAPKYSTIIQHWFHEYDRAVKIGFLNYKREILGEGYKITDKIYGKDDIVYLTQHACIQVVRQKRILGKHNVLLYKAEDSMFKVHGECDWKPSCIKERVRDPNLRNEIPFIKLRGDDRD